LNRSEKVNQLTGSEVVSRNLKEKSVRGALFMGTWSGVDFVMRMAATVVLARLLIPEYFGLVAMVGAVLEMAESIKDLGLSAATVQRERITHEQVSNLLWINASAGFLFFLFFSAISYAIAGSYDEPRLITRYCCPFDDVHLFRAYCSA
jgi:O-antigen/teichoic acid export membrane protein